MTPRTEYEAFVALLNVAPDATRRRLYFAALLAREARLGAFDFIVVGGSAIEIYTSGEYTSADIDIVAVEGASIREILAGWRFKREGRGWENRDLGLFVDLVRYPYTGDVQRTRPIKTPYGTVRVAAVEDLIVKRLAAVKFWKIPGDLLHANMLAVGLFDTIDWDYLERFARAQDVWDLAGTLREEAEREHRRRGK